MGATKTTTQRLFEFAIGVSVEDFGSFHVNPRELNDLIEEHGVYGEWRRAVACPCIRPEQRTARPNCPHCLGLSWVYPENQREPLVVLLHSRSQRLDHGAPGWREFTTAQALVPIGLIPGIGDQFYPDGEVHVVQQHLVRARRDVDPIVLRERLVAPEHALPPVRARDEVLLYERPTIESVHWVAPRPGATDERLASGREGHDYRVSGRRIVWADGAGPEAGFAASVRYRAPAAYVALKGVPVLRSEHGTAYPYRVEVERLDAWAAGQDLPDHRKSP